MAPLLILKFLLSGELRDVDAKRKVDFFSILFGLTHLRLGRDRRELDIFHSRYFQVPDELELVEGYIDLTFDFMVMGQQQRLSIGFNLRFDLVLQRRRLEIIGGGGLFSIDLFYIFGRLLT